MPDKPIPTQDALYRWLTVNAFGADRARLAADIAETFGVRAVIIREVIHDLRLSGKLVGSSSTGRDRGYYLPRNRDEAVAGCGHLVSRVRSVAEVYEAQREAIQRTWPAQPSLFDCLPPASTLSSAVA